jgi:hypothetical protein
LASRITSINSSRRQVSDECQVDSFELGSMRENKHCVIDIGHVLRGIPKASDPMFQVGPGDIPLLFV